MSITHFLTQTCNIVTRTSTIDGVGNTTYVDSNVFTSVPCLVDTNRLNYREATQPTSNQTDRHVFIYIDSRVGVEEHMIIVVGSDRYEIVGVHEVRNLQGGIHHLEVQSILLVNK